MNRMRTLPILLVVGLSLTSCSPGESEGEIASDAGPLVTETERLNTWFDAEFAEYLDFSPISKSARGDTSEQDKLDDVSMAALDERLAWRRASVAEMREKFDRSALTDEGKRSWDLWEYLLERSEAGEPFKWHSYIFGRRGPHTGLPRVFLSYHDVDSAADMDDYISRLDETGRYLRQYLERAKTSAEKGIRAPYFDYEIALSQSKRVISGEPFGGDGESAIWMDATGKIDGLLESGEISETEASAFTAAVRHSMTSTMQPAYEELIAWLEADRENVPDEAKGAWALPNGEAYYRYELERMTTLPLTADEIHETGIREVARIRAEMRRIKEEVGFEGDLNEFFTFLREDDQFYLPNTDEGREAYLDLARGYLAEIEKKLPEYFGILPAAELEVKRVEAFREQAGGAAHYSRGTPDGSRPGVFYAHLADMRATSVYRLENLAYHEGLPGHHLQIAIQQELEDIPRFRTYHGFTAYSEGWGLYSEWLGKDMGFYQDPYKDFGRLTGEIWRAIRLVVDTGIHAKKWTEEEAIEYALDNSPRPEATVESEIRRYFNMPAQATAYKVGMLKIQELRARAEQELGDAFDIRGFHDAVLGSGPLPLPILERKIENWIAETK